MQSDYNHVIAVHRILFDVDLLFFVDVFQPLSAYHVHSVQKEANMKSPKKIVVLASTHSKVWLHAALLAFEPFFVFFTHSLIPFFLCLIRSES